MLDYRINRKLKITYPTRQSIFYSFAFDYAPFGCLSKSLATSSLYTAIERMGYNMCVLATINEWAGLNVNMTAEGVNALVYNLLNVFGSSGLHAVARRGGRFYHPLM